MPDVADLEIGLEKLEDIEDVGNASGESEVHGLDFAPVGEGPVADDQGIGVADAGDEIENVGIENTFLEHGLSDGGWERGVTPFAGGVQVFFPFPEHPGGAGIRQPGQGGS